MWWTFGVVLGRVAVEWIGVCCGCVRARLMEWVELWECWWVGYTCLLGLGCGNIFNTAVHPRLSPYLWAVFWCSPQLLQVLSHHQATPTQLPFPHICHLTTIPWLPSQLKGTLCSPTSPDKWVHKSPPTHKKAPSITCRLHDGVIFVHQTPTAVQAWNHLF